MHVEREGAAVDFRGSELHELEEQRLEAALVRRRIAAAQRRGDRRGVLMELAVVEAGLQGRIPSLA